MTIAAQGVPSGPSATKPLQVASLYVGDLDPAINEPQLVDIFKPYGTILNVRVCRDIITQRSLGYGYVNYDDVNSASKAMEELNFKRVGEKCIRIMWQQRDPALRYSGSGNIFVKNLKEEVDSRELSLIFKKFGEILSCKVMDDESGKSRGYGFVHFKDDDAAKAAIEKMNGDKEHADADKAALYVANFIRRNARLAALVANFTNVYIKQLLPTVDKDVIEKFFSKFGGITSAAICKDKNGRAFAFCNFEKHDDAVKAIEASHDQEVEGVTQPGEKLYVQRAQPRSERLIALRQKYMQCQSLGNNLYVRNFDAEFTEKDLNELFKEYGVIRSCRVMTDANGISRGFGFVSFENADQANAALREMNGRMLNGKPLVVNIAQRRDQRLTMLKLQLQQRLQMMMHHMHPPPFGMPGHPLQRRNARSGGRGNRPHPRQQQPQPQPEPQPPLATTVPPAAAHSVMFTAPSMGFSAVPRTPQASPAIAPDTPPLPPISAEDLQQMSVDEQRAALGDRLYIKVHELAPDHAPKITGMFLEMNPKEALALLSNPKLMHEKVTEALCVLKVRGATCSMSNNPYLAHYFGEALEDNLGDVAYDAAANFAYFPNAVHMSHRVFRPSKVYQPTPEVSGTGGDLLRSDGGSAADVLQSTPATEGAYPSSTLDIPLLRNYVLDKPPRPESGPEVPTDGDCEVTHLLRKDLLEPTAATSTDVEALEWDLMIEKSRAAIKQARELLTHECGPYIGAERVSSPQNYSTVLTPASPKTASSVTISAQTAGSDDNVASQFRFTEEDENWCPGSKDRNLSSSPSYASGLVEGPHPAPASGAEMGPMTNTKEAGELLSSPEPHMPTSTLPMTEVKAQTMTTPSQPLHNLPTVTEARCVLLTPNPNAAACLAKRLTRRPPPALAVSEEDFSTTSGAPAVVGKVNGETGRAIMYAESVPTPYQSVERNHRKKERSRKIDGTLVSSLGSVLEQFARSLQARGIGNGCRDYHDSNSWDANCVKLEPVQQTENELKEKKSKCGAEPNERRGRKHCIPPPQVLVGSAPLVGASCAFPGDHYGAFIRAVPTSELPVVNADFYSNVSRRASSVRRTGSGVAPAAPSYARPTESWLCKGVQLSGGEYGDNNGVIDVKEMSGGCP